jgi:hypothetical protein
MASDVPPFVTADRAYFRALLRYERRLERDVPVVAVNLPSIATLDRTHRSAPSHCQDRRQTLTRGQCDTHADHHLGIRSTMGLLCDSIYYQEGNGIERSN